MPYILSTALDIAEKARAVEILEYGFRAGFSPTEITTDLTRKGLSYRRQDMLSDTRRAAGYAYATSDVARERFDTWYDTKFEPFRKGEDAYGNKIRERTLTGAEAGRIIKIYQEGEIIPEELKDLVDEWGDVEEENPSPEKVEY